MKKAKITLFDKNNKKIQKSFVVEGITGEVGAEFKKYWLEYAYVFISKRVNQIDVEILK